MTCAKDLFSKETNTSLTRLSNAFNVEISFLKPNYERQIILLNSRKLLNCAKTIRSNILENNWVDRNWKHFFVETFLNFSWSIDAYCERVGNVRHNRFPKYVRDNVILQILQPLSTIAALNTSSGIIGIIRMLPITGVGNVANFIVQQIIRMFTLSGI